MQRREHSSSPNENQVLVPEFTACYLVTGRTTYDQLRPPSIGRLKF